MLCQSYIGEILIKADKKAQDQLAEDLKRDKEDRPQDDQIQNKLQENYYLEDEKKLLDILIQNGHPILTDLLGQVDLFNKYNQLYDHNKTKKGNSVNYEGMLSEFE